MEVLPVIIVGKGPTARHVSKSPDYKGAARNGALRLCDRADWLFINDVCALKELSAWDIHFRAADMVVPTHLHADTSGRNVVSYRDFPFIAAKCPYTYSLPSAPKAEPTFGTIFSVGETAVAWLLAEGYRQFLTLGIDPEGGYSDLFAGGPQIAQPKRHFKINWQRIQDRVKDAGGTIHRID